MPRLFTQIDRQVKRQTSHLNTPKAKLGRQMCRSGQTGSQGLRDRQVGKLMFKEADRHDIKQTDRHFSEWT